MNNDIEETHHRKETAPIKSFRNGDVYELMR